MTSLPAAAYWGSSSRKVPDGQTIVEDVRNVIAEFPGGGAEVSVTLSGDTITPAAGGARVLIVDTEAAAAADDLKNVDLTQVPDGAWLMIGFANVGRVVTVKHAAGGSGQFSLRGAVDLIGDATTKWLLCRRSGTTVVEFTRFGFVDTVGQVVTKTAVYVVKVQDVGKVFSNEGAGAIVPFTLPAAAADLEYGFYVQDADGIRVTAAAGDTIRVATGISAPAGKIESTTLGSFVRIKAMNATEWVAVAEGGSWTAT